ncbi:MAG: threonine ammonia-lyase [bacterium]|jgi:threonine dehydratase
MQVSLSLVQEATVNISAGIHRTPLTHSQTFSKLSGNEVYLKTENLQKTGSFKIRGALNKINSLTAIERKKGVIAISAGNHAQGVAFAAAKAGITSIIVMPENAPIAKVTATKSYGAQVELYGNVVDECAIKAKELQEKSGAIFVHPFNDPLVIAGQGTIGLEILSDLPGVEAIVVPVGGGGLISGIATAVKEIAPKVQVIGVEASKAASMQASLAKGEITSIHSAKTIADGIAVKTPGTITFDLVNKYVDGIVTVDEEEIANAILMLLERAKLIVEGAGAASLAAIINNKLNIRDKKVVALLSGGNIDVNIISQIIERGLVKAGRKVKLKTRIEDRPGHLHALLGLVADLGANVFNIYHDREKIGVELGYAEVDLDLETRDKEHSEEIYQRLNRMGYNTSYVL